MPPRHFRFVQVDVFTRQVFGGNQLAVFTDARGLSDREMQAMTREMNYSETTFVLPPESSDADARVRIFTPATELPFAGHPVVGTGFVLGLEREKRELAFQLGIGTLAVEADPGDGRIGGARMEQPLPTFRPAQYDLATLAGLIGVAAADFAPERPIEYGSAGVEFLYLPLRSLEAVRRARGVERAMRAFSTTPARLALYLFTTETESPEAATHARMFSLALGSDVREDPATGGASGPFGAYLVRHNLHPPGRLLLEQGFEMQRPSQIEVDVGVSDGQISRVRVGGGVVRVAEGELTL